MNMPPVEPLVENGLCQLQKESPLYDENLVGIPSFCSLSKHMLCTFLKSIRSTEWRRRYKSYLDY